MKNTSELYFNGYESTNCMLSSACASSRSRKYHSWVTWFLQRNRGGPRQGEGGLGMEATNNGVRGTKFPCVGWLLLMLHSKLLQDHEANY
jgi:hypothetical protein